MRLMQLLLAFAQALLGFSASRLLGFAGYAGKVMEYPDATP
jgi:hypothetical protein